MRPIIIRILIWKLCAAFHRRNRVVRVASEYAMRCMQQMLSSPSSLSSQCCWCCVFRLLLLCRNKSSPPFPYIHKVMYTDHALHGQTAYFTAFMFTLEWKSSQFTNCKPSHITTYCLQNYIFWWIKLSHCVSKCMYARCQIVFCEIIFLFSERSSLYMLSPFGLSSVYLSLTLVHPT